MPESIQATAQKVHELISTRFIHPQTNLILTTIAGGDGLEDCSLYGGFYLACLVDAYAVTGEEKLRAEARRIFKGLWGNSTVSNLPGFLARGFNPDGKYRGDPSVDQYTAVFYGYWRYYHSPLVSSEEQEQIRRFYTDALTRLEKNDWRITREDGQMTTFGRLHALMPTRAERLLSFLRAGYDVTGDDHWLEKYHELLPARLPHCLDFTGINSWVCIQSQVSMRMLIELETDQEIRKTYLSGSHNLAEVCQLQIKEFDRVPPPTASKEELSKFYPGGKYFTETMRNPIEAVTVLLLTEEEEFRPVALEALNKINERLDIEYFTNVIVVPWEWDQWLYLKK